MTTEHLPPLPEPSIKESCPDGDYEGYTADQMHAYAKAALSMSPKSVSGTSEPVAWRVWRGDAYELFFNEDAAKRRCECFIRQGKPEPLFAAPVAQAKPLTDQAKRAISFWLDEAMMQAVRSGANSVSMPDEYVEIAAWLAGIGASSGEGEA